MKLWRVPSPDDDDDDDDDDDSGDDDYDDDGVRRERSSYAQVAEPITTILDHTEKVRDVKYCADVGRLASASTSGDVVFSDPNALCRGGVEMFVEGVGARARTRRKEAMCLATDGKTIALGSQRHVTLLDPRDASSRRDARLVNGSVDGVRSLSFRGDGKLLTCGGGGGAITFFDVRAGKFLPPEASPAAGAALPALVDFRTSSASSTPEVSPRASPPRRYAPRYMPTITDQIDDYTIFRSDAFMGGTDQVDDYTFPVYCPAAALRLEMTRGWLDREHHVYLEYFQHEQTPANACYAHEWDSTGTRLLVAGGPLAFGLRGCYLGVWS